MRYGFRESLLVAITAAFTSLVSCADVEYTGSIQPENEWESVSYTEEARPFMYVESSNFYAPLTPPKVMISPHLGTDSVSVPSRPVNAQLHFARWPNADLKEPDLFSWPEVVDLSEISAVQIILGSPNQRPTNIIVQVFDDSIANNGVPLDNPIQIFECDLVFEECPILLSEDRIGISVDLPYSTGQYNMTIWAEWNILSSDDGYINDTDRIATWLFSFSI